MNLPISMDMYQGFATPPPNWWDEERDRQNNALIFRNNLQQEQDLYGQRQADLAEWNRPPAMPPQMPGPQGPPGSGPVNALAGPGPQGPPQMPQDVAGGVAPGPQPPQMPPQGPSQGLPPGVRSPQMQDPRAADFYQMKAQKAMEDKYRSDAVSNYNLLQPVLDQGVAIGDQNMVTMVADKLREMAGNNPIALQQADTIGKIKVLNKDEMEFPADLTSDKVKDSFFKAHPELVAMGFDRESLKDFKGIVHTKGGKVVKMMPDKVVKEPAAKKDPVTAPFPPSDKNINYLLQQTDDPRIKQSLESYRGKKNGELDVTWDDAGEKVSKVAWKKDPTTSVSVSGGVGGPSGKFTDDDYAAYYASGRKNEFLPRAVQGSARANQGARVEWDKGFRDWMVRMGKAGAGAAVDSATARGDAKAVEKIVIQENAIGGFEKGAKNAMSIAFDLSKKLKRGEIPKVNSWSQAIKYHLGDPNVKPFHNSVVTAMTEYMKVVTAGTNISSAELSVAAQERAKELLDKSDSHQTFIKQMNIFMKEMRGKMKGITDQKTQLSKGMAGRAAKAPTSAPTTRDQLLKDYMKAHPSVPASKIKESEAFKADLARFGL